LHGRKQPNWLLFLRMIYVLTALHILVCLFLIIVVLLQHGKSADLAGTFAGMGSQTAYGPRGAATVLSRATAVAVVVFMLSSLSLAILTSRRSAGPGGSVLGNQPAQTQPAPAQTPPAPPPKSK
jgi:preprotein translocase subunit SecG